MLQEKNKSFEMFLKNMVFFKQPVIVFTRILLKNDKYNEQHHDYIPIFSMLEPIHNSCSEIKGYK